MADMWKFYKRGSEKLIAETANDEVFTMITGVYINRNELSDTSAMMRGYLCGIIAGIECGAIKEKLPNARKKQQWSSFIDSVLGGDDLTQSEIIENFVCQTLMKYTIELASDSDGAAEQQEAAGGEVDVNPTDTSLEVL